MQQFFIESSGATLLESTLTMNSTSIVATAISWENKEDKKSYIRIKVSELGTRLNCPACAAIPVNLDGKVVINMEKNCCRS